MRNAILTILNPSIHEYAISFRLFCSLISVCNALYVSVQRFCMYFIFWNGIINGIVLSALFSNCSLLQIDSEWEVFNSFIPPALISCESSVKKDL